MSPSTIFFSHIVTEHSEKTTDVSQVIDKLYNIMFDLSQVIDKLYHIMLYLLWHRYSNPTLAMLFRPFGFLSPKDFSIIWLPNLLTLSIPDEWYSERTWWWLFWTYLMMVILSVHDECYSERIWWWLFWAYLMNVILSVPDECYSRNASCALN